MTPKPLAGPEDAQSVFDALDAFIEGTSWVNASASVTFDGGGATHTIACHDRAMQNSFTYTTRSAGVRVSVAPNAAALGPGQTQQFTASATDAAGVPIAGATFTWSAQSAGGTVDATGLYTAPATIAAATSDTVTAALDGQQAWAAVSVQLNP